MAIGSSPASSAARDQDTGSVQAAVYFSRRLTLADASVLDNRVDEGELLALAGNKVILGEPGMGKSELMREVGRQLGVEPVTAIRFINAKNPAKLVPLGKPLLIDGLDEAMSRREGDAVDAILAQLEDAGSPPFILSCRSREWQARGATNLRQLYGAEAHHALSNVVCGKRLKAALEIYVQPFALVGEIVCPFLIQESRQIHLSLAVEDATRIQPFGFMVVLDPIEKLPNHVILAKEFAQINRDCVLYGHTRQLACARWPQGGNPFQQSFVQRPKTVCPRFRIADNHSACAFGRTKS